MTGEAQKALHFHCGACHARFEAEPTRTADLPERDWQPYEYFADCQCGAEAPQAAWELNLAKAWANSTGPKTPAGVAATSANLKGHPTPEETKRTRFNAMKSGVFAKTAQYWPAKPGKYPHCKTCEHFNRGCDENPAPEHKNPPACLKRTELFMQFQIAFETRDPKMLTDRQATLQALVWQMVNDMILQVIQDGVSLKTPEWYYDKDGSFHWAEGTNAEGQKIAIHKIEAHPLLRHVIEFMNRNGMTLPDSGMTMKVQEDESRLQGFLEADKHAQENSLGFQERQTAALENLSALVRRSQQRRDHDPVLIEHAALESEGKAVAP